LSRHFEEILAASPEVMGSEFILAIVPRNPHAGHTSSSLRRISAQLLAKPQISKNRVSATSANAFSSSGVDKLKRRTTSPPYFTSKLAGSCELDGLEVTELGLLDAGLA